MTSTVREDRRRARRGLAALSILTMALASVVPALELGGAGLALGLLAGSVAVLLQASYVLFDAGTLAPAVVLGLVPTMTGSVDASFPRVTALVGGVLVFVAAEVGRLSLDQRTRIPMAADPPMSSLRSTGLVAGLGAVAGLVVLGLWLTHLPPAGILAAFGAVAVVVVAVVIAHAGAAMDDAAEDDDGDGDGEALSPPRAAPGAGR